MAHYVTTGDLARALVRESTGGIEAAFAWGWITHLLADVIYHPRINQAVARRGSHASDSHVTSLSYADDSVGHMRVEMGLDGFYSQKQPLEVRSIRLRPPFAHVDNSLSRACQAAYGQLVAPGALLRCHQTSLRLSRWVQDVSSIIGSEMGPDKILLARPIRSQLLYRCVQLLTWFAPGSLLFAVTHARVPDDALVAAAEVAEKELRLKFQQCIENDACSLDNFNLDLGIVETSPGSYPLTQRALVEYGRRMETKRGGNA